MSGKVKLPGFARYQVDLYGSQGKVSVWNKATGGSVREVSPGAAVWRLTDDEGAGHFLTSAQIIERVLVPLPPPVEKEKMAKLTPEQVKMIRSRLAAGEKHSVIAADYKIHPSTVSDIKSGKLHKSIL